MQNAVIRVGILMVALLAFAVTALTEEIVKRPVPDEAAQAKVMAVVKEVYGSEYQAAKTPQKCRSLAKELLIKGTDSQSEAADQFILLKLARDIATQGCDSEMAFQAIEELDSRFKIDALEMKKDVLCKLQPKARAAGDHKNLAEQALTLTELAVANDDFTAAKSLGDLSLSEAHKADDKAAIHRATARIAELTSVSAAFAEAEKARAVLEKTPDDPPANLAVGRYKCLYKGDWDGGLPMLALGNDAQLQSVAAKELVGATTPATQAALGDQWWDLADTQEGMTKKRLQGRAVSWYRKALPDLTGLAQAKIEKRIESIRVAEPLLSEQSAKAPHKPAVKKTARIGGSGGGAFEEGNPAVMLVGLSVTTRDYRGHNIVASIQAIFQKGRKQAPGAVHGNPQGKPVVILAKPGFAVGEIIALGRQAGDSLDGFRVIFMRVKGHKLDPAETYQSDWIGGGNDGTHLAGDGNPVVGIFGSAGAVVDGLGLIQVE